MLAPSVRDVTLYMNAEDAAMVRGQLPSATEFKFKIGTDAALARGDLRVASGSSLVDGTLAARCAEIIAATRVGGGAPEQRA